MLPNAQIPSDVFIAVASCWHRLWSNSAAPRRSPRSHPRRGARRERRPAPRLAREQGPTRRKLERRGVDVDGAHHWPAVEHERPAGALAPDEVAVELAAEPERGGIQR